jgi:hypothetical protein
LKKTLKRAKYGEDKQTKEKKLLLSLDAGEIKSILTAQVHAQLHGGHRFVIFGNKSEILVAEISELALVAKTPQVAKYRPVAVHERVAHLMTANGGVQLGLLTPRNYGNVFALFELVASTNESVHVVCEVVGPDGGARLTGTPRC